MAKKTKTEKTTRDQMVRVRMLAHELSKLVTEPALVRALDEVETEGAQFGHGAAPFLRVLAEDLVSLRTCADASLKATRHEVAEWYLERAKRGGGQ